MPLAGGTWTFHWHKPGTAYQSLCRPPGPSVPTCKHTFYISDPHTSILASLTPCLYLKLPGMLQLTGILLRACTVLPLASSRYSRKSPFSAWLALARSSLFISVCSSRCLWLLSTLFTIQSSLMEQPLWQFLYGSLSNTSDSSLYRNLLPVTLWHNHIYCVNV